MDRMTVGGAVLDRIEETVDTSFTAEGFVPAFDPEVLRPHMAWLAPRYYSPRTSPRLTAAACATPVAGSTLSGS
ncbi:MAG: hypothetical protein HYR50_16605 [Candidatus Rokubacteria bacterium]|nr:hypothetical protein [Candidatus Rokubacteria bacterium]